MDLKFSFGGASPDHGHEARGRGDAPSGIPLPFSTVPPRSTSGVLEVRVRRSADGVTASAVTGDGVVYCDAEAPVRGEGSAALARAVRSAASRAVAALEGPLADSVTGLVLGLDGEESAVLDEFGIVADADAEQAAAVDEGLQRRIGVAAGTPIRFER
ncbi:hypothetical protein [Leucobacter ruminantium]|uniref:Uncharacterized protein n=1 Tax=Leucobacter ruminantium TaxID=1289170 RepID=A0A939RXV8_9MICO|nr:hypothetical protein [Leucobacter ruminantium]MBO1804246.1 hypothetical protein [Leucobacter ruminantium]